MSPPDRRAFCTALLCLPIAALAQTPHTHHHSFAGAKQWSQVFDDPARDAWQKPHEIIEALGLAPDAVVADIGAGTGYFSVRLAHMAARGRVFAVDVEPDMVRHLAGRASQSGLKNLQAVQGSPDDPKLPEPVDRVLLVDTYHHIEGRVGYFARLRAQLRPKGQVAIIDFTRSSPVGPPPESRMLPEQVIEEMSQAGYTLAARHTFLPNQFYLMFAAR